MSRKKRVFRGDRTEREQQGFFREFAATGVGHYHLPRRNTVNLNAGTLDSEGSRDLEDKQEWQHTRDNARNVNKLGENPRDVPRM